MNKPAIVIVVSEFVPFSVVLNGAPCEIIFAGEQEAHRAGEARKATRKAARNGKGVS